MLMTQSFNVVEGLLGARGSAPLAERPALGEAPLLGAARPVEVPPSAGARPVPLPPVHLRLPVGDVWRAERCECPYGADRLRRRGTTAQTAGLRFERRTVGRLRDLCGRNGWSFESGVWYSYLDRGHGRRYCQVDALVRPPRGGLVVVEIKRHWVGSAWWQLERLYRPVVSVAERSEAGLVCVVGVFDPAVVSGPFTLVGGAGEPAFERAIGRECPEGAARQVSVVIWS